jgi:hypothetical protein
MMATLPQGFEQFMIECINELAEVGMQATDKELRTAAELHNVNYDEFRSMMQQLIKLGKIEKVGEVSKGHGKCRHTYWVYDIKF